MDWAMKVSTLRLHLEVFLFMIDCVVKWLVSQDTIKKIKKNSCGMREIYITWQNIAFICAKSLRKINL